MDLADSIYRECHEHLRHADDKRDTLIGFYGVVIGLLFAAHAKDSGLEKELLHLVDLVVALVGLAVCLTVIQYRKWHLVYSWSFEILQRLQSTKLSSSQIQAEWPSDKKGRVITLRKVINPLGGTEAATFAALLILSFVPWYLVIAQSYCVPQLPIGEPGIPFVLGLLTYSVMLYSTAAAVAVHASLKGPFGYWILAPFGDASPNRNKEADSLAPVNRKLLLIAAVALLAGLGYLANLSWCGLNWGGAIALIVIMLLGTLGGSAYLISHKSPRDAAT